MNWKLLTPSVPVIFEETEPICMLVPCRMGDIERITPVMNAVFENPSLADAYKAWSEQRFQFIGTRDEGAWEKDYVRGRFHDIALADEHRTRLNLAPFREESSG